MPIEYRFTRLAVGFLLAILTISVGSCEFSEWSMANRGLCYTWTEKTAYPGSQRDGYWAYRPCRP